MRFIVDLPNFRTALAGCAKTVADKYEMRELLRCVHIVAESTKPTIVMEALDGYQLIEYTLAAEVVEPGEILVEPKLLLDRLPKKGCDRVVVYEANGQLTVEDWREDLPATWVVTLPTKTSEGEYIKTDRLWSGEAADERVDTVYNPKLLTNVAMLCQLGCKESVQVSCSTNPLHPTIINSRTANSEAMRARGMVFTVRP